MTRRPLQQSRQLVGLIPPDNVHEVLSAGNKRGNTLLHLAVALGMDDMCSYLAQRDPELIGTCNHDGETALHIAVSDAKVDLVRQLVGLLPPNNEYKALSTKDERGNTPLHLAAALGTVAMCKCIPEKYPQLIGARNHDDETPLFLAVLNGKTKAFLCLHEQSPKYCIAGCSYCTRSSDGDSILHCAIFGEYFGLAYHIINLYEGLVYWKNKKGQTALHVLATKPSAFKSGSRLGIYDQIIYRSVFVDPLAEETLSKEDYEDDSEDKRSSKYPDNYRTSRGGKNNGNPPDVENPNKVSRDGSQGGPYPTSAQLHEGESSNATQIRSSKSAKDPNLKPQRSGLVPPNYETLLFFFNLVMKGLLNIALGLGFRRAQKILDKKEKHEWAIRVMDQLLEKTSVCEFNAGSKPKKLPSQEDGETMAAYDIDTGREKEGKRETPLLLAAKYGVIEMVEKILNTFPLAIRDSDLDEKNVVLLAVENRQPHVYMLLQDLRFLKESVFRKLDNQGNSALHLAATLGKHKPCRTPGAAFQMQWELKWYKFVKDSMPRHYFARYNTKGLTPEEIFNETHKDLVKEGGQWLIHISQSCSVVAALAATVAFATSSTVPGGVKQDYGTPVLQGQPAFDVFAISSIVALCFSVTSLIMFLAVLTSRYQERDFARDLPNKLLLGLSSLFISIAAMLVSFCSGHLFVVKDNLKYAAYPLYAVTCLPVTLFAAAQFPLYVDLFTSTFNKVPQPGSNLNDVLDI